MLPENPTGTFIQYASKADPEWVQPIPKEYQEQGVVARDSLPAQFWNWLWNQMTTQHNLSVSTTTSILHELQNVLKLAGINPDEAKEDQLADAIKQLTMDVIGDFTDLEFASENVTTVVEALNALYDAIKNDIDKRLKAVEDKIPDAASSTNKLTDEAFVLRHVATNTANFRGEWPTWADVPTDGEQYPVDYSGNHNPTENDYMVVRDMSDYSPEVETVIGPITEVSLQEDGALFDPYTTYGGIETSVGVNQVRIWTTDGAAKFKYYVDGFTSSADLKEVSGSFENPGLIEIDPSQVHMIVVMIQPADWETGNTLYSQTVSSSSPVYKGAWQFKYTGDWTKKGKDGWSPEFSLGSLIDYDELDKHYARGSSTTLDIGNATIDNEGALVVKKATITAPSQEEIAAAIQGRVTINGRRLRICELDAENHALILW